MTYQIGAVTNISTIWITFQRVGFHHYPNAPEEVAYLRDRHRHIFHYKVEMNVTHDNREVEFHMLKSEILALYDTGVMEADNKSCEMLARDLLVYLLNKYQRWVSVEVSEDGECGAVVDGHWNSTPNDSDVTYD